MEHGQEQEGLKWTKEILRANPRHSPTHDLLAAYYDKHGEAGLANFHRLSSSASQDDGGLPGSTGESTGEANHASRHQTP